jgi:nicotinamidase-related amidase
VKVRAWHDEPGVEARSHLPLTRYKCRDAQQQVRGHHRYCLVSWLAVLRRWRPVAPDRQPACVRALLVKTEHEQDKSTWTLSMLDDDQGFIFRGTEQADFVPGLHTDDVPKLVKTRDSAFVGTDLLLRLRNWDVDTIVLAGVSTHNCVAQTGADAFAHNFRVIYASDATGSEDAEAAEATQAILSREYRQRILTVSQIQELLSDPAATASPVPETAR